MIYYLQPARGDIGEDPTGSLFLAHRAFCARLIFRRAGADMVRSGLV